MAGPSCLQQWGAGVGPAGAGQAGPASGTQVGGKHSRHAPRGWPARQGSACASLSTPAAGDAPGWGSRMQWRGKGIQFTPSATWLSSSCTAPHWIQLLQQHRAGQDVWLTLLSTAWHGRGMQAAAGWQWLIHDWIALTRKNIFASLAILHIDGQHTGVQSTYSGHMRPGRRPRCRCCTCRSCAPGYGKRLIRCDSSAELSMVDPQCVQCASTQTLAGNV